MLCPRCGYYTDREDSVCPECGEILNVSAELPTEGAEAIRQGKRARQAIRDAAARVLAEHRLRPEAVRAIASRRIQSPYPLSSQRSISAEMSSSCWHWVSKFHGGGLRVIHSDSSACHSESFS